MVQDNIKHCTRGRTCKMTVMMMMMMMMMMMIMITMIVCCYRRSC